MFLRTSAPPKVYENALTPDSSGANTLITTDAHRCRLPEKPEEGGGSRLLRA